MEVKYISWSGYNNYGDDEPVKIIGQLGFEFNNEAENLMIGAGTMIPPSIIFEPEIYSPYYKNKIVFCSGVENPEFPVPEFESRIKKFKHHFKDNEFVGLRCEKDKEILGFGEVIGDPLYLVNIKEKAKIEVPSKNKVLINIGQSKSKVWGGLDAELNTIKTMCKFINELKKTEDVLLFCVWNNDIPFAEMIATSTKTKLFTGPHSLENIFSLVDNAKYVISYKLHSMITALSTNTPVIPIEYRPKIKDVARDFGIDNLCIKTSNLSIELLFKKIAQLKHWDYEKINKKKLELQNKLNEFVRKVQTRCS